MSWLILWTGVRFTWLLFSHELVGTQNVSISIQVYPGGTRFEERQVCLSEPGGGSLRAGYYFPHGHGEQVYLVPMMFPHVRLGIPLLRCWFSEVWISHPDELRLDACGRVDTEGDVT